MKYLHNMSSEFDPTPHTLATIQIGEITASTAAGTEPQSGAEKKPLSFEPWRTDTSHLGSRRSCMLSMENSAQAHFEECPSDGLRIQRYTIQLHINLLESEKVGVTVLGPKIVGRHCYTMPRQKIPGMCLLPDRQVFAF